MPAAEPVCQEGAWEIGRGRTIGAKQGVRFTPALQNTLDNSEKQNLRYQM